MLNWDDPLSAARPPRAGSAARRLRPRTRHDADDAPQGTGSAFRVGRSASPHDTRPHVRPGQGLVANAALMTTAGAAPVVDPNPFSAQVELPFEDSPLAGLGPTRRHRNSRAAPPATAPRLATART